MDVVILTERRYAGTPTDTGPVKGYVDNLLLEDQLVADALRGRGLLVDRRAWCDKEVLVQHPERLVSHHLGLL